MSTILLGLHLPLFLGLAQIRDRRPLRYGEWQSGYHCVSFANYSQFTDSVLLHMRVILHRRDTRRIARRAREGPLGDNSVAQLVGLDILHDTYELHSLYRRVRQGELPVRAREGALGYDSAHRLYPTCTIYPVGAAIGHPHNGKPSRQFSILHYQFSITANR